MGNKDEMRMNACRSPLKQRAILTKEYALKQKNSGSFWGEGRFRACPQTLPWEGGSVRPLQTRLGAGSGRELFEERVDGWGFGGFELEREAVTCVCVAAFECDVRTKDRF